MPMPLPEESNAELLAYRFTRASYDLQDLVMAILAREENRKIQGEPLTKPEIIKIHALAQSIEERIELLKPILQTYLKTLSPALASDETDQP